MRRIIFSWLFIVLVSAVYAEDLVTNNPDNRAFWGVRGSFDINIPGDWNTSNGNNVKIFRNGYGASIGVVYNVPIVANLFFEPGVSMYYDTYKYDNLRVAVDEQYGDIVDATVKKFGFRMPLHLGYRFDIWENGGISLLTGPQISYGIVGKISCKEFEKEGFPTDLYGKEYDRRRLDVQWGVGVGFNIGNYYVSTVGYFGLVDLIKGEGISFHENLCAVSFGYNF